MATDLKWYVVHTYSGFEDKARLSLLERIKANGMEDKFGDIIVPVSVEESVTKSGKKKTSTKIQFPGYMIVQMEMSEETKNLIKGTARVTGFVGNQKDPVPLKESEVLRLISPDKVVPEVNKQPDVVFEKGDGIKVIDGPFSNFDGIVDEVQPDKAKLRVLVSIFGRETPVELEYRQVEKIS